MTRKDSSVPFEILLVEDDAEDALLIQGAFKHCDNKPRITVLHDGEQALAYLRRQHPYTTVGVTPDLILLDLNLPKLDGREVLATIRKEQGLKLLPVIVLTTSNFVQDVNTAYSLNANCYIIKPMDLTQLIALAQAIERFWMHFVEFPAMAKPLC